MSAVGGAPSLRLLEGGAGRAARDAASQLSVTRSGVESRAESARRDADTLRLLVVALCGFGLVMVLASSSVYSIVDYGTPWSLFEHQALYAVVGGVAFAVCARIDHARVRRLVPLLVLATVLLLFAVLAPGLGKHVAGASRWIGAGPFTVQPSELAKLVFALYLADLGARRWRCRDPLRELFRPAALVLAVLALLVLLQPDMGTAVVFVCTALGVLYALGLPRKLMLTAVGVAFLGGGAVALVAPYRRARLLSFINPFAHATTSGYQLVQSLAALGSGHLTGSGLGGSAAIWGWLPNAQTDYIFAIVGNQLGLVGAVVLVAAYAWLGWLGVRIAARAPDTFSSILATSLTCWLVAEALINIGGVIGIIPETGIPLPFLSSGGSSLVISLAGAGMLVGIARRSATGVVRSRAGAPARGRATVAARPGTGAAAARRPRRSPAR